EDGDLLLANAVRSVGVGRDADAGLLRGADRRPQDDLTLRRDALGVVGDLDDAGLDAGAFDALLDLAHEQRRDLIRVAAPERARDVAPDAGRGDDIDAAAARQVGQKADVAAEVERREIDDRLDAALARLGQRRGGLLGQAVEIAVQLRVGLQDSGRGRYDVLVGQGEAEI